MSQGGSASAGASNATPQTPASGKMDHKAKTSK